MHKFDPLTIFVFQAAVQTAFDTTSRVVYDKRSGWPKIISKIIYLSVFIKLCELFLYLNCQWNDWQLLGLQERCCLYPDRLAIVWCWYCLSIQRTVSGWTLCTIFFGKKIEPRFTYFKYNKLWYDPKCIFIFLSLSCNFQNTKITEFLCGYEKIIVVLPPRITSFGSLRSAISFVEYVLLKLGCMYFWFVVNTWRAASLCKR